ncbi:MAG: hypothetical protein Q9160_003487 [Pyrenula sp. 1 TL-2023]
MVSEDVITTGATGRRERPLRHLQGICVRNVSVVQSLARSRGRTISDDDLPANLKSPAKLLAQRETQKLKHSSSAADLKSPSADDGRYLKNSATYATPIARSRPSNPRRKSIPYLPNTRPQVRQQELQELVSSIMVDTIISLHHENSEAPIYVSEAVEQSLNPSFQCFDLNGLDPRVTRSDEVTIKLWAKTTSTGDYEALVWLEANLRSLQFIGKNLENFYHPLPENCILFQLSDGFYTSFTDLPMEVTDRKPLATEPPRSQSASIQFTTSYDALMRVANLDECIQDAFATQRILEAQIESVLGENGAPLYAGTVLKKADEGLARIKHAISSTKADIAMKKQDLLALQRKIDLKRKSMSQGRLKQANAEREREWAATDVKELIKSLTKIKEGTNGQIRRIGEELGALFPIEPIPGKPLYFTIRDLTLPNSCFEDIDKDSTAGALGYTAQLVQLLSQYLSVSLPYPVQSHASQSYIQDPISAGISQRTFPLYPGSVQYRFEYGVFLLNKDIEFLMSKYGLKMLDIRHTLPNLKYLLYVVTAGTGEIPLRKAGGVKALITGRLSPSISRRESEDSAMSAATVAYIGPKELDYDRNRNVHFPLDSGKEEAMADRKSSDGMLPAVGTFKRNLSHKASMPRASF